MTLGISIVVKKGTFVPFFTLGFCATAKASDPYNDSSALLKDDFFEYYLPKLDPQWFLPLLKYGAMRALIAQVSVEPVQEKLHFQGLNDNIQLSLGC